jgi:hypothetical protein
MELDFCSKPLLFFFSFITLAHGNGRNTPKSTGDGSTISKIGKLTFVILIVPRVADVEIR